MISTVDGGVYNSDLYHGGDLIRAGGVSLRNRGSKYSQSAVG